MDLLKSATVAIFTLTVITSFLVGANRIKCEKVYFGELDQISLIECNVSDSKLYVYWFKGSDTSTYPIVSYEAGKIEWGENYEDKYDLTDDFMLKIIDTELNDKGNYTVRIYSSEFDYETVTTELRVYSRPDDPCLLIDSCDLTCDDCYLNVTNSGKLSCHVHGARPRIDLNWIVTNQSGISFTFNKQETVEESDTHHTTIAIAYTVDGCGRTASLYCNASVSEHPYESILDNRNRNVRIYSETCRDVSPGKTNPPSKVASGVVRPLIISAIIFVIFLLVVCFILWRKGFCLSRGRTEQNEYRELGPTNYSNPQAPRKDAKRELFKALIKHYEQFCFIKPLPWGEPIPIDALYTTCRCTVTTKTKVEQHTSEYLHTPDFNFDSKRVLITADLGYGKTTFTQHLVKTWISHVTTAKDKDKVKTDHFVLIYLHLKAVTRKMVLSNVVHRMLPTGNNLTCSDIERIFQKYECHILLDGLDELSMSLQTKSASELSDENTSELTIGNLIDNHIDMNKYKKLRVWVTSRDVDDTKTEFSLPYSKVNMLGFSRHQITEYIHKTCKYYYQQKNVPEMGLFVKPYAENSSDTSDNATSCEADDQLSKTTDGIEKLKGDMNTKSKKDTNASQSDSDNHNVNDIEKNISETHFANGNTNDISEPTVCTGLLEDGEQDSNKLDIESNESKRKKDEMSTEEENKTPSATDTSEIDKKDHDVPGPLKLLEDNVIHFIEVNDIIKIFSNTPLLQIMIIHIITCRILDPKGRYKEMNMNKLTTVIRLVITCLESRYVQKVHKDSIKLDIKTLESKLGETAFKSKLRVTLGKREFWDSELGKEDVQLALEIGLLKHSKGAGSRANQLEELAFSSHSGIEFYHEFFKEYLAAQYISENKAKWEWLDEFINGSGDEATVRLLQFMFGMNNPKIDSAYKKLVDEKKMWNNLIDCIYEVGDPEKKRSMLADLKNTAKKPGFNMNLNINYLERKHHSVAVSDFCKECNEHQISISRMTFREACAIDFLKNVTLPSLQFLIFYELKINETQFVSILNNLRIPEPKFPGALWFVACEVPKTLTGKDLNNVELAMKNGKMKIYRTKTDKQTSVRVPVFNCQSGKWETAFFPKNM